MKQIILLSYPRSGNTWCRYIIETCFNIRTYGYDCNIDVAPVRFLLNGFALYRNDMCVIKRHNTLENFRGDEPLILILRNKEDAVQQHSGELEWEKENKKYEKNIETYENWEGRKITISYDDLMDDVRKVILLLADFFDLHPTDAFIENFMNKIDLHRNRCIHLYCDIGKQPSVAYGI